MAGERPRRLGELDARGQWLLVGLALACLPLCAADYVPATDLPQHVAQVRLLGELWGLSEPTVDLNLLRAHPLAANTLVYWPLLLLAQLLSPRLAGKLTVALILVTSVWAIHRLAKTRQADPMHALLALLPLFSAPLYWGFLNFLSGLPLWLLFLSRSLEAQALPATPRRLALDALLVCLLLWAHVFWLLAAVVALALFELPRPHPRRLLTRALSFAPAALLVALWYPALVASRRASGFELGAHYLVPVRERLSGSWLVESAFGGVRGALEPIATCALLAYAAWMLVQGVRTGIKGDPRLASVGCALALFALLAPDRHLNTLLLNTRFMPVAILLLLLALPSAPARGKPLIALTLVGAFSLVTAFVWAIVDQVELAGLRESIANVPPGASLLELDFRKHSRYLRGSPFLQLSAYAQAEHGGELAFSFAEHGSGIVTYERPRQLTWTPGLEWFAERATLHDVAAFDCTLVNGSEQDHQRFRASTGLRSPVEQGYFRSYCRTGR